MDRRAANERQEALWRVFLMFVVMALIIVRTGLVCRGLSAVVPLEEESQDAAPPVGGQPSSAPADLYRATLAMLSLAEAAGRLFILTAHAGWELMNRPQCRTAPERHLNPAGLCGCPVLRLDTS